LFLLSADLIGDSRHIAKFAGGLKKGVSLRHTSLHKILDPLI
jgi:hypothetical protein